MTNCLICGVGGQGTVLASRVLAQTALRAGQSARTAETIGMAQRGGCVVSHIRYGKDAIFSPLIPQGQADIILGLEPAEAARGLPYLKKDGLVVTSTMAIQPASGLSHYDVDAVLEYLAFRRALITVDGKAVASASGSRLSLNIAVLGAAIRYGSLGLSEDIVRKTLIDRLPQRSLDINLIAMRAGGELARVIG